MQRQPGDGLIVWYDLMSTDPASTDAFYAEVFGWAFEAESTTPNGYRMVSQDGERFGGVLPWDAVMSPSSWMGYVQVSELDELVDLARDLGGAVHVDITETPDAGRFAVLADPTGAPFYLFDVRPEHRVSRSLYNRGDGFPIWNELITTDTGVTASFYERLAGWQMFPISPGDHPYLVAKASGVAAAGIFQPATAPAHSMWIVSFQTSDTDATITRVVQAGGRVLHPANTVPGVGRTAWVADPTGAVFGLMQPEFGWLDRL